MQVKKFEARTVKEALDLVKSQLGPDAIILSVRDNKKAYGLVGEGSIEITAAASEESIKKRRAVESRLPQQKRDEFIKSPARMQKEIIHQFVDHHNKKVAQHKSQVNRRYVDIEDEQFDPSEMKPIPAVQLAAQRAAQAAAPVEESFFFRKLVRSKSSNSASKVQQASQQMNELENSTQSALNRNLQNPPSTSASVSLPQVEMIHSLQGEIKTLKQIIAQFQQVPQKMQNSSYPGSDYGLSYEFAQLFTKLIDHGVAQEIVGELLMEMKESLPIAKIKNPAFLEGVFAKNLLDSVMVKALPFSSRIQVFMGPTGSGKTSSLVKLASHLIAKENKKIAFATADTFKVGAADQMRIYAQILNTSFSIIRSKNDWMNILKAAQGYDYLFVDYPGLNLRTQEETSLLERLLPPQGISRDLHLVLSATDQDQYLTDAAARYQKVDFDDVLFNFLDETYYHGNIFNFQHRFKKPFLGFGLGSKIPEDFEFATPERVLDLVMKITQSHGIKAAQNDNKSY